jgi:FkbM family methyltransferase
VILAFKILFKELYLLLSSKKYRIFLWLSLRYGNGKRYERRKISFSKYVFTVPDSLSFIWQYKEIFVDEYYNFASSKTSPVILDCGANIGTSCLYFKTLYPHANITAFEANPDMGKILHENLMTNGITDVEIVSKAVWIHNEGIQMSLEGSDASSILSEENKTTVSSVRLKDILDSEDREIDMLKIDIEGAETRVLLDCRASLSKVRNIFVEYHSYIKHQQDLQDILQVLTENNFRYFILSAVNKQKPFINRMYRNNAVMDLQINIFAYKD